MFLIQYGNTPVLSMDMWEMVNSSGSDVIQFFIPLSYIPLVQPLILLQADKRKPLDIGKDFVYYKIDPQVDSYKFLDC